MTDAKQLIAPEAPYSMLFPGTWLALPFTDDDEQLRARIKRAVLDRAGRDDRLARQRRSAVDELLATAQQARRTGADAMYLAMELLPGIPFPASLVVVDDVWPEAARAAEPDLRARLARAYPNAEIVDHRMGPVARIIESGKVAIGDDVDTLNVRGQFWIPYPDARRLLLLTISAPMAVDVELWATLFDSIADSLTWKDPA